MTVTQRKVLAYAVPLGIAILVIAGMALLMSRDTARLVTRGSEDLPPVIEFTWTPAGAAPLSEIQGNLKITDDYALDFASYRMKLPELGMELDLPIPGLIGKDYEQPVSFSLMANNPKLAGHSSLTVDISIADDKGQVTNLTRVIPFTKEALKIELK